MLSIKERDVFLSLLLSEGLPRGASVESQLRFRRVSGVALYFDLDTSCKVASMSGKTYGIGLHGGLSLQEQSHALGYAFGFIMGLYGITVQSEHTPLFWPVLRVNDILVYPKPGSLEAEKAGREERQYCKRFSELWLSYENNQQEVFRFIRRIQKEKVILLM